VCAILAAGIGAALIPILPWWAELIYYTVAGVIWGLPLKPLFGWMNGAGARD